LTGLLETPKGMDENGVDGWKAGILLDLGRDKRLEMKTYDSV
jgi:hypothetical protein